MSGEEPLGRGKVDVTAVDPVQRGAAGASDQLGPAAEVRGRDPQWAEATSCSSACRSNRPSEATASDGRDGEPGLEQPAAAPGPDVGGSPAAAAGGCVELADGSRTASADPGRWWSDPRSRGRLRSPSRSRRGVVDRPDGRVAPTMSPVRGYLTHLPRGPWGWGAVSAGRTGVLVPRPATFARCAPPSRTLAALPSLDGRPSTTSLRQPCENTPRHRSLRSRFRGDPGQTEHALDDARRARVTSRGPRRSRRRGPVTRQRAGSGAEPGNSSCR